MRVVIAVGAALLAGACLRTPAYECTRDDQCALATALGTCEPTVDGRHFCAVPDDLCASHVRFGDSASDAAGTCAGGPLPAGRGPDACLAGARFPAAFSSCTQTVCAALPTCCNASWGPLCVEEADARCHLPCGRQLAFAGDGEVDVAADDDHDGAYTVIAAKQVATEKYSQVAWADLDGDAVPELAIATADFADSGHAQELDHFDGAAITAGVDLRLLLDSNSDDLLSRYSCTAIAVGDYDHDGWPDVAWLGVYPMLDLLHNRERMQFEFGPPPTVGPPDLQDPIAEAGQFGDVDGDGKDELMVISDGHAWIIEVQPTALSLRQDVVLPDHPYWAAWGDVDGDGRLDLAVAGNTFARVFHNDGTMLQPSAVWQQNGPQLTGGAWLDADGDGDLDLAISERDGKLDLFENTGGALALTPKWRSFEDQGSATVIAADVDGDHDLDLVVANAATGPTTSYPSRIYLNNGDGTFELGQLTLPLSSYQGAAATARTHPAP